MRLCDARLLSDGKLPALRPRAAPCQRNGGPCYYCPSHDVAVAAVVLRPHRAQLSQKSHALRSRLEVPQKDCPDDPSELPSHPVCCESDPGAAEIIVGQAMAPILLKLRWQPLWAPPRRYLPPSVMRCPDDAFRCRLRLKDGRHGLRLTRHFRSAPAELRRVHRRKLNHGQMNVSVFVNQFGA